MARAEALALLLLIWGERWAIVAGMGPGKELGANYDDLDWSGER